MNIQSIINQGKTKEILPEVKKIMGKDDFLKLLVTQLKYQDPTDPLRNQEFVTQTAQFSSLEQMQAVNESMKSLLELQKSSNRASALSLMGKQVTAGSSSFTLTSNSSVKLNYTITSDADVNICILDDKGNVVKTIKMGKQSAGNYSVLWDATNNEGVLMKEGQYSFKVYGKDKDGKDIESKESITGIVNGVNFDNEEPYLLVGGISVPLSTLTVVMNG